jgi:hypothetical protein
MIRLHFYSASTPLTNLRFLVDYGNHGSSESEKFISLQIKTSVAVGTSNHLSTHTRVIELDSEETILT